MSGAVVKEKGNMSERSQEEDVVVGGWVGGKVLSQTTYLLK